jgi:uncharacterized membrane protein YphA (DoxX/SURF4 family)
MKVVRQIAPWFLQVLLGALFLLLGSGKFMDPSWVRSFARWGYPAGFHYVVGVVEALAGVALFVPRLTTAAASVLVVVMAGATLTHLAHGETRRLAAPLTYLVLLAVVGWLRRGSAVRLSSTTRTEASAASTIA